MYIEVESINKGHFVPSKCLEKLALCGWLNQVIIMFQGKIKPILANPLETPTEHNYYINEIVRLDVRTFIQIIDLQTR